MKTRLQPLPLCALLAALLQGCSPELEPGFEGELSQSYHCGSEFLVAFSPRKSARAQISLELSDSPGTVMSEASGDFEEDGASFRVYVGSCLQTPGCTDVINNNLLACSQSIAHEYEATSGLVEIELAGEDGLQATLSGVVLEGSEGEPDVEVDLWEWPLAEPGKR